VIAWQVSHSRVSLAITDVFWRAEGEMPVGRIVPPREQLPLTAGTACTDDPPKGEGSQLVHKLIDWQRGLTFQNIE
jgi:hypothetical protein